MLTYFQLNFIMEHGNAASPSRHELFRYANDL